MGFNDIYKLRIHCRLFGSEVLNVMHFKEAVGTLPANPAQTLANDFLTNMGTTLRARATTEMAFEFIEVVRIVPYGDGPALALFAGGTNGTATGGAISTTLAEVVTLSTGRAGRRYRGRIFLGGGPASANLAGAWAAAQSTRTQAFVTAMVARYVTSPLATAFQLGVWSKLIAGPDPPFNTDAFTPVTSATVRTTVRNQRRRQIGVGR